MFIGDYLTGDLSQWDSVQNVDYNSTGVGYQPKLHTNADGQTYYPIQVVDDAVYGKAARFEVHGGDYPGFVSGDRSEVGDNGQHDQTGEGVTRWYRFAFKLDPTFPADHTYPNWCVLNQWHMTTNGSPPFGFSCGEAGYITLVVAPQSSPMNFLSNNGAIWKTPYANGTWHEFKMCVTFSADDKIGQIQLWHNGVRQTFIGDNGYGSGIGTDTYHVRTLVPGAGGSTFYKEGYYRAQNITAPGVVYHARMRAAATEDGLS